MADTGGDGPATLFVHGAMMDHTVWYKQVEAFRRSYRCVCLDLRGHRRSCAATPDISFEDHCDDLAALIDRLGLRDVTLVGWSMAGCICQVFVTCYPGKVARLVLVDTIPQRLSDDRFPYGQDPLSTPKTKLALQKHYEATCDSFGHRISPDNEQVAGFVVGIARDTRQDVAIHEYVSTDDRSRIDLLPRIDLPTTTISGDRDQVCKPQASTFMAQRIPVCNGGVISIKGAGHATVLTHSAEFNRNLARAIEGSPEALL